MYNYKFAAEFYNGKFDKDLLEKTVPKAVTAFNNLNRKATKIIDVKINDENKQLTFTLDSDIKLEQENYLRSCQYFCKELAKVTGMEKFISGTHLLVQTEIGEETCQ